MKPVSKHSLLYSNCGKLVLINVRNFGTFLEAGFCYGHLLKAEVISLFGDLGEMFQVNIPEDFTDIVAGVQFNVKLSINETGFTR